MCAAHNQLEIGAIMVFVAMVCDVLDGKVARLTKTEGAFGAELDSLADVVSFGVAPAILMHRLILGQSGVFESGERLLWFITVFYPVMAAIRLARYNVEHTDEATPYFRGIPSPGAAALVCSWIIFSCEHGEWLGNEHYEYHGLFALDWFHWAVIGISVLSALLMVSTVRYPHLGNTLLGRMSFRKVIVLIVLCGLLVFAPSVTPMVATTAYLLYGIIGEAAQMFRKWQAGRNPLDDPEETEAEDAGMGSDKPETFGPMTGR
jgi:CDP-diacylglycerol---serine O-phosphatidyltransferase